MSDVRALAKPSPAEMKKPYYCDYAGVPTIVGETRAWSFVEGAWKEISHAEAYTKARLIAAPRQPGEDHPFVVGTESVQRYFTVMAECATASKLRVGAQ